MERNKKITASESKKIETIMKRVIRQTGKMIRQNPQFSAFRFT